MVISRSMLYFPPWLSSRSRNSDFSHEFKGFPSIRHWKILALSGMFYSWTLTAGCVIGPSPYLPPNWKGETVDAVDHNPGLSQPRLQVFIMYSGLTSSHSALRILKADGTQTFWDPAGEFARSDYPSTYDRVPPSARPRRVRDIIVENPPDLSTFLQWRWEVADTSVEVFEWHITPQQAERLSRVLLTGKPEPEAEKQFSSSTWPAFCTVATSEFLERFADPEIHLSDWYFFPHSLAKTLYTQSPDRVLVFAPNTHARLYRPPSMISVQQAH